VIEKTSREIEKQHDDRLIYAQHGHNEIVDTVVDLDDEEAKEMLDDEGVEITEAEDLDSTDLGEEL
jgi:hypothetical protein